MKLLFDRKNPNTIIIPSASKLRELVLQEIIITGNIIKKQLTYIDINSCARSWEIAKSNGCYGLEKDGDIHFDLGTDNLQPHVPCEIQKGDRATLRTVNKSIYIH